VLRYVTDHAPISVREVAAQWGEPRGLARTTVLTMMERLRNKGHLTRTKRDGAFQYAPAVGKQELMQTLVQDFVQKTLGGSVAPFVAYLADAKDLSPVEIAELRRLVEEGSVTLLDARPLLEFRQGHIPTARWIPVEEVERRLADLPRDREVVAYCRGPYCVYAEEAGVLLQQHGFKVRRLEVGFPEWRAAGLPVETGDGSGGTRNNGATYKGGKQHERRNHRQRSAPAQL
jgi:predicted transcriptional regulator